MRTIFLFFLVITVQLQAQTEYNYISYNDIYIQKGSKANNFKIKLAELNKSKGIGDLFGNNYQQNKYVDRINDKKTTRITSEDGLNLIITEDSTRHIQFDIKSNNYSVILGDGKEINIGMNADKLMSFFPLSYSKREMITHWTGMNGKIAIKVFLAFTSEKKVIIEDSWIVFVLDREGGKLERFLLFEPE